VPHKTKTQSPKTQRSTPSGALGVKFHGGQNIAETGVHVAIRFTFGLVLVKDYLTEGSTGSKHSATLFVRVVEI
jgi:hypothetical protein